ncbi:unnamed protein product [Coregonus sp. 'balchen']|nr:unnamed protein product [Coregonus sp. 'balchen']
MFIRLSKQIDLLHILRLKKRRQVKQSQSEKAMAEQNPSDSSSKMPIISCPDPTFSEPLERMKPNPPGGSDGSSNTSSQAKREKRRPPGTVEYTVGLQESLSSISLKFNITPNKLVQLNRLFCRIIYPGQKLFVPDLGQSGADSQSVGSSDPAFPNSLSEKVSQDGDSSGRSVRPLRRELSPPSEDESPATVKYIKMSCKYFTDGMGVVGGVMIVTPNNIMFDPHKSDPLVLEHGCEEYGLLCPMEEVVSVALYDDISRMKLKDTLPSDLPQDLCPLYRPGEWEELPSECDLNPFSRYEALDPKRPIVLDDINSALSETVIGRAACEPADQSPSDEGFTELELPLNGSTEEPKSGSRPPASATNQDQQGEPPGSNTPKRVKSQDQSLSDPIPLTWQRGEEEDEGLVQNSSIEDTTESLPVSSETEKDRELLKEKPASLATVQDKNSTGQLVNSVSISEQSESAMDQNRKLSFSETAEALGKCSSREPSPPGELQNGPVVEEWLSEEEKQKRSNKAEVKSWLLERMQAPIQNMLLSTEEKSKTPPMFLCLKVGKPMRKSFVITRSSSPAHTRGKQPEYWFAVPQERVDHLYAFFVQWSPDVYGKEAREQGFVVVEKEELNMIDNFFSDPVTPRSWEIITINEAKRRQSFGSYEGEEPSGDLLPMLSDPSALLQDTHIEKLACRLPARVQGYPWRLAYSTVEHGTSLKTLYRSLLDVDSPVLLVIKDMNNQLFGGYSTHPFRVSEHSYGTGETFLFSFCPEIKMYNWTGENSYFVKGNIDSLQMGGGGGQIGLWVDADLHHGTTSSCATFHNQPLSTQKDFTIHSVEVWAFE